MNPLYIENTAKDLLRSTLLKCGYVKYSDSKSPSVKNTGYRIDRFNSMLASLKQKRLDEAAKKEQEALEQRRKAEAESAKQQAAMPQSPTDRWKQNVANFASKPQNLGMNPSSAAPAGLPKPPSFQITPKTPPSAKVAREITFKWKV